MLAKLVKIWKDKKFQRSLSQVSWYVAAVIQDRQCNAHKEGITKHPHIQFSALLPASTNLLSLNHSGGAEEKL